MDHDDVRQESTALGDSDLVLRTRSGDRAAFGELWRRHYRAGVTVARNVTSSLDPDDLVQEAFTRIYQSIVAGGGPTSSFRAYLFTSIRNTAAAWGRARRETAYDALDEVEDPSTGEQAGEAALDRGLTHRAFRSLPTRWQEVLWYSEIEQMKPVEIAPLLGMKATAVAQLTFRAREGLREAWIQAHLRAVADGSTCQSTIELLGAYSRNNLCRRDQVKVEAHLAACVRCSIVASEAREVSGRLALVLLPLALGAVGGAGYLAAVQCGNAQVVALAAVPSAAVEAAVTALPTGLVGAATGAAGTGAVGTVAGTSVAAGAGAAAGTGVAAGSGAAAGIGAATAGASAATSAATSAAASVAATASVAAAATGATTAATAASVLTGLGAASGLAATSLMVVVATSVLPSTAQEWTAPATSIVVTAPMAPAQTSDAISADAVLPLLPQTGPGPADLPQPPVADAVQPPAAAVDVVDAAPTPEVAAPDAVATVEVASEPAPVPETTTPAPPVEPSPAAAACTDADSDTAAADSDTDTTAAADTDTDVLAAAADGIADAVADAQAAAGAAAPTAVTVVAADPTSPADPATL